LPAGRAGFRLAGKGHRGLANAGKRHGRHAAWRRIDEAGMGPGGDEITRHEPAAAPGEMVREPREKAAGMAGSVAADGIRHRLTVDVEARRLVQKIDGAPLRQWRAVAKGAMAAI